MSKDILILIVTLTGELADVPTPPSITLLNISTTICQPYTSAFWNVEETKQDVHLSPSFVLMSPWPVSVHHRSNILIEEPVRLHGLSWDCQSDLRPPADVQRTEYGLYTSFIDLTKVVDVVRREHPRSSPLQPAQISMVTCERVYPRQWRTTLFAIF